MARLHRPRWGGGDTAQTIDPTASQRPVTIESGVRGQAGSSSSVNSIFENYSTKYPWITVKSVRGIRR